MITEIMIGIIIGWFIHVFWLKVLFYADMFKDFTKEQRKKMRDEILK